MGKAVNCAAFYNHLMKNAICIRGSGIVGQVLALLLARKRIGVSLLQAAAAKQPDLRSFALNAASKQILEDLRVWPTEDSQATPVQRMQVFGDTAGEVSFDAGREPLAWIVDAAVLQDRLATAISFSSEINVVADKESLPMAELSIICEGRASETRDATGTHFEQFAYDQTAIAAHIICEQPHELTAWQWMQSGEICAFLPRGPSAAGNSVSLVWSVPKEKAVDLLAMPEQLFARTLEEATRDRLGHLSVGSSVVSWPLMLAQAQHWSGQAAWGAWVLAGDAAHAVHPLAGQGLNLGLGDTAELAKTLAGKPYFRSYSDAKLLRAYERSRKGEAAMLRLATDGLQRMFSSSDTRVLQLRNWGMQGFQAAEPLKAWLMQRASGLR